MAKKVIFLIFLLAISAFAFSYGVTVDNVYLDEQIKIDANLETLGLDQNILCQFLFYDSNTGFLVDRATDEYSLDNNHVYSVSYTIKEPPFFRGDNYTVNVNCDNQSLTSTFKVMNLRGPGNLIFGSIFFLEDNVLFLIAGLVLLCMALFIGWLIYSFSYRQ